MRTARCRMKPYIQPFERHLAIAELQAVARLTSRPLAPMAPEPAMTVETDVAPQQLAERLSYFESVECDGREFLTEQALKEATVYVARNGLPIEEIRRQIPVREASFLPNRRCLRYGTHGVHEYRGKFFPQLVRSLINISKVPSHGLVADPMCGSGTTLVEAALAGTRSIGLDMNPLSVFMSSVKCALLAVAPETLTDEYHRVRETLLKTRRPTAPRKLGYLSSLPAHDQKYLNDWFSPQVLDDLDAVSMALGTVEDATIRDFMRLALSNILRRVSWQKEDDLRVRKEVRADVEIDAIREFLEELGRSVRIVAAFLWQTRGRRVGKVTVQEGDSRELRGIWDDWHNAVDAVITSPPYATALPYLDTDRLSLCYLGLLARSSHRDRDKQMIGNREITDKTRRDYWDLAKKHAKLLPQSVVMLIGKIDLLNAKSDAGFRRRNLPALLAKYFFDMREVLSGVAAVLKPGAPAFVVVGNNHTIAGGRRVEIETAKLLSEIAVMVGLQEGQHIPMEMLVSRDIFRKNAVAAETVLEFRKPL